MRDKGLYFVKFCGKWTVAEYDPNRDEWFVIGQESDYRDEDFEEIGGLVLIPDHETEG